MLLKRNLLETVTIISCSGTLICILLNYVTNISPIQGIWFPIYFLFLFIVSVTFSFKLIQWLLHLNKPLKYDFEGLIEDYPSLEFLSSVLPRVPKTKAEECKEYDTNELSVISTVLERRLVSSWYTHYVSQEIGFPFACKQMLDQMIGRTFQICNKIETKDVYVDICSVLITHLKEYKKATKRREKSPNLPIETLYKKSHKIFDTDKTYQSAEHCTNLLRIILKELVPWELWDTPHSELLIRILSKKLDNFVENTLADPVWINDRIMTLLKGKKSASTPDQNAPQTETTEKVIPDEKLELIQDVIEIPKKIEIALAEAEPKIATPTIESALSTLVTKTTAPILQRAIDDDDLEPLPVEDVDQEGEDVAVGTESLDIKLSPVLRQRRGRQGRNEVKIYDRIIEGSVKTWETDNDLQCISMGQDLLASLNGEITLSRLWGQDPIDSEVGKESRLWFGEEDALEMEVESKEQSPVKKEHSPKPTDVLLKDLQTTVHQAKTKIGDLQVPQNVLDVPNNDEAAGMMEGLLDFGIAGLKKGLRFTGLSDDSQEKSPSHKEKEKPEKSPPPDSKHKSTELSLTKDTGISSVLQREENGSNSIPPLVKQQRVSSQDSVASLPRAVARPQPPLQPLPDSPEPEYEEAADLSTSIAKLRCLLQQRAEAHVHSHSSKAEDIWWESAEETRGRTQHHPSSRPVDTAAFADEYDMHIEKGSSPGQTSNNMQRLDKLFQRTVTGVFNSIKTAVGAEGEAEGAPSTTHDWAYVCTSIELSVGGAVARLVGSRRAFNHVDAALDSLEQLAAPPARKEVVPEDFEEWCAVRGAGWCAGAELAAAAGLCGSHLTYRVATLLFADLAESLISVHLESVSSWLRRQVFEVFERMDQQEEKEEPRGVYCQEDVSQPVLEKFPALEIFGEETVRQAVNLVVSSLSHKTVNKDVIFRVLDLYTVHFKKAAGQRNPSFDAN